MKIKFLFLIYFLGFQALHGQMVQTNGPEKAQATVLLVHQKEVFGIINGKLCKSLNKGISWTRIGSELPNFPLNCLASLGSKIFIGLEGGGVYVSNNNGMTWLEANNGLTTVYTYVPHAIVYSLKSSGTKIFAGTRDGAFLSEDYGANWIKLPGNNDGNVNPVSTIELLNDKIFMGSGSYPPILRSLDGGKSFQSIGKEIQSQVTKLCYLGDVIFAGTEDAGIYKSTDGGNTWTQKNLGIGIYPIRFILAEGNILYAGTERGLYVSKDLANNWSRILSGNFLDLKIDSSMFLMGSMYNGLYSSFNNGLSWNISTLGFVESNVSEITTAGGNLFAICDNGVFLTEDKGETWLKINQGKEGLGSIGITQIGSKIIMGTITGVLVSNDKGQTWESKNKGLTNLRFLNKLISCDNSLYVSCPDGIFYSDDEGENWFPRNEGLTNKNIYSLTSQGNMLFLQTYDNVIEYELYYYSSDETWVKVPKHGGPDYYDLNNYQYSQIALIDLNDIYISSYTNLYHSQNQGTLWEPIYPLSNNDYKTLFILDSIIYLFGGKDGMVMSKNRGKDWETVNTEFKPQAITKIGSITFFGTVGQGVWRTDAVSSVDDKLNYSTDFISVYPNPTRRDIKLCSYNISIEKIILKNILGQELDMIEPSNINCIDYDLGQFPAGIYFLECFSLKQKITKKIIIE